VRAILDIITNQAISVNHPASVYSSWYLELLSHRVSKFSNQPLFNVIRPFITRTDRNPSPLVPQADSITLIYQSLVVITTELASGSASIDSIAQKLADNNQTSDAQSFPLPLPFELYQFVFRGISLITLLFDVQEDPVANKFQLSIPSVIPKSPSRHSRSSVWTRLEYPISTSIGGSVHIDLDQLLSHFGQFDPPRCRTPPDSRRDLYEDAIIASNVNYWTLSQIGRLRIEWVESLSLHLELHERSSVLRLFAYPSFCALLCEHYQSQETFLSK
jgi:hypothetical protein